ncbi:MAG TPA: DUF4157 domain-containing protein [Roseiarcus sp.]|nr:DUF4157 domain-containing protein [Roseiarcus sp.]
MNAGLMAASKDAAPEAAKRRSAVRPPMSRAPAARAPQPGPELGNQATQRLLKRGAIQAKLAIGSSGDALEQEADRVADQAMRAPGSPSAPPQISRKCAACEDERKLQKKRAGSAAPASVEAPASVHEALRSPGQPLDAATRSFMEPRLGHDFSQVRVHTDPSAAASARGLHARAYTMGTDVAFADNQFSPATAEGKRLLSHELAHVVQQSSGATAIQRAPDEDDDAPVAQPAAAKSCPSGAVPYEGVCLTDEILDVLPEAGDVHAAEKMVKAQAAEAKAQARVEEKYSKVSNADLSKKIDQMRERVMASDQPGVIPASLTRLEKERDRRRALPISPPTTVDHAIAMLEEAWSLTEKENPPDIPRAAHLVHVVNTWLQTAAAPNRYDECFSGMAETAAMTTVGMAKANVASLDGKFRLGASMGGWWPATINSLKAARELVQIMSGEKRIEDTEFNAISHTINRAAVVTPLVGTAIMAAPALIAAVPEIPALPATIQGVSTATWGQTLFAATLSSSFLSHVISRSSEASATEGGSNPLSIVSAAFLDAIGAGKVFESIANRSVLTDEPLHLGTTEQVVGAVTGLAEFALNLLGAKDLVGDAIPQVKAPATAKPPAASAQIADELGPIEDFPFRGGGQPLPTPESPNTVYRTMSWDEAAQSLRSGKLPPPIRGAEGERFVSLDSQYSALFREKNIADLEKAFGAEVESGEQSLRSIDERLTELKAEQPPNQEAISKLTARREELLASQEQQGLANKAEAQPIIKEWHEAPGQQIVVEIELEPGTIDDMLTHSVDRSVWGNYSRSGKDVYLWKLERGYGRNIGIPKWQLDAFNARIKAIRLYAHRGMKLFGETKPTLGDN